MSRPDQRDLVAESGEWTVWPCEHGGVQVEPGRVPPHHQCAACGVRPVAVVPRADYDDALARLEASGFECAALTSERERYKEALGRIVQTWEGGPKGLRGPQMLVAIAKDALRLAAQRPRRTMADEAKDAEVSELEYRLERAVNWEPDAHRRELERENQRLRNELEGQSMNISKIRDLLESLGNAPIPPSVRQAIADGPNAPPPIGPQDDRDMWSVGYDAGVASVVPHRERLERALEQIRDYRFMTLNTTKGREQSHEQAVAAMRELARAALDPKAEEPDAS